MQQGLITANFYGRRFWKIMVNLWAFVAMFLFVADFLSGNKYDSQGTAVGIIYIATLGIYASTKEFQRWKTGEKFLSLYFGEFYIFAWTVIMLFFVLAAPISNGYYRIPDEFATIYVSLLGIFAVTRHSKYLKQK